MKHRNRKAYCFICAGIYEKDDMRYYNKELVCAECMHVLKEIIRKEDEDAARLRS